MYILELGLKLGINLGLGLRLYLGLGQDSFYEYIGGVQVDIFLWLQGGTVMMHFKVKLKTILGVCMKGNVITK